MEVIFWDFKAIIMILKVSSYVFRALTLGSPDPLCGFFIMVEGPCIETTQRDQMERET